MKVTQHRPAFMEGFANEVHDVDNVVQLLAIPFIANFANDPNFHRFSKGDGVLLAEYRGGKEWWVCARLEDSSIIDLPKWDGGIYEVVIDGNDVEIPGSQVACTCGDDVTLRDGRIVKRSEHL